METILNIYNGSFEIEHSIYEGFVIVTTEQQIKIGIQDGQYYCEKWGYLITNDNTMEFIGSELISIAVVDQALNKKYIEEIESLDAGGAMFVNLETTAGLLQFVAYNAHNGYYGHDAVLISKQLNHSETL
ncbi:MAG: hypothetical protein ABIN80_22950 [Dyadobacter sp.]|uniref:DUF7448 domain-containing protein n=1 Tax=Dyadobacter sp. TaxID=1914288 RepID=UPI003263A4A5